MQRFTFVGTLSFPKEGSNSQFYRVFDKNGKKMRSVNFSVKEGNNFGYVQLFGGEQKIIKTMDIDGKPIEVAWEDRFDEDVVASVSRSKKIFIDLGRDITERKEFISAFDAVEFLNNHIRDYKGNIQISGQVKRDLYQGKWYDKFNITSVTVPDSNAIPRLKVTTEVYYNKSCIDKSDFEKEKRLYLNGYVQEYINKDEGTKYVPMQFVLDTNKYKPDNEHHMKLLKYKMKYLDITSKNYQKLMWECVLLNGGEEIPFDESQLTDEQKEQIELGIRKLDDFRPRGQIVGNKITEYRLFDPVLTGAYSEGLVDTGMTAKEFEEEVYQPPKEEDFADMMNTPEEEKSSADTVSEDELDDLELF